MYHFLYQKVSGISAHKRLAVIMNRNDEQNHVRYGHHWLPQIMALGGETRSVEEFVKATQAKFVELAKVFGNRTPHSLPPERRLTGNKILALVGVK